MAREVYAGALANLRQADAVIANLSPWRGPNCDPGCAFEVGFVSTAHPDAALETLVTDAGEVAFEIARQRRA